MEEEPEEPKVSIQRLTKGYIISLNGDEIRNRVSITPEEIRALKQLLNEMKL